MNIMLFSIIIYINIINYPFFLGHAKHREPWIWGDSFWASEVLEVDVVQKNYNDNNYSDYLESSWMI